jgi:uncharacterized repeat protein (TIGR01451 family)
VKAAVTEDATISSYRLAIHDAGDSVVKSYTKASTATTVDFPATTLPPGTYVAKAIVITSLGDRTSADCTKSFIIPKPLTPTHPSVSITKDVDGQKQKVVEVNKNFTYTIVVKNTGDVVLKNVAVTDTPPDGITLIKVTDDKGAIKNNRWSYSLPSLNVGQSITVHIPAKVDKYTPKLLTNTACVETPTVTGTNPDDCDEAPN